MADVFLKINTENAICRLCLQAANETCWRLSQMLNFLRRSKRKTTETIWHNKNAEWDFWLQTLASETLLSSLLKLSTRHMWDYWGVFLRRKVWGARDSPFNQGETQLRHERDLICGFSCIYVSSSRRRDGWMTWWIGRPNTPRSNLLVGPSVQQLFP